MNYIVGTGYHYRSDWDFNFFELWKSNTKKYTDDYFVMSTGPSLDNRFIACRHNIGHVGDLIKENKGGLCGWSASVCALAMIAYNCGRDFIYKEADCLWFGDVIGQMYRDCEGKQMVFGKKMQSAPYMACAQSTFLIRHGFILDFLRAYLFLPHDKDMLPEDKFVKLEENHPDLYGRLSFGVDREKPIPYDDSIFYAQQITESEISELRRRGII